MDVICVSSLILIKNAGGLSRGRGVLSLKHNLKDEIILTFLVQSYNIIVIVCPHLSYFSGRNSSITTVTRPVRDVVLWFLR